MKDFLFLQVLVFVLCTCTEELFGCANVFFNACVVLGSNLTRFQSFYIRNMGFFEPKCPNITWMHGCTLYGSHTTILARKINDYFH